MSKGYITIPGYEQQLKEYDEARASKKRISRKERKEYLRNMDTYFLFAKARRERFGKRPVSIALAAEQRREAGWGVV